MFCKRARKVFEDLNFLSLVAWARKFLIKEGALNRAPSFLLPAHACMPDRMQDAPQSPSSGAIIHLSCLQDGASISRAENPPALPLFGPAVGGEDFTKNHTYH